MSNIMDNTNFAPIGNRPNDLQALIQQAKSNPKAFEEHIKRTNPQAYQMAKQLRNCSGPQDAILQLAQQRGIDPNLLRMLNL